MYDLIIRDATLVSSGGRQVADVAVRDGSIAYVGPRPPLKAREEISAMGKFLMPGVIDTAVQFDPNGKAGIWDRESRAAVTGGVTTVLALPGGQKPVFDRASAERRIKVAKSRSFCNFGLWGAARGQGSWGVDNTAELAAASSEGLVVGTLAYLSDESGDDTLAIPIDSLERFLDGLGVLGLQLQVAGGTEAVQLLQSLRSHERHVHLVHLSTAAELNLIDPVRGDLPLTAGVTPHHLFLSSDDPPSAIRTRPPVRPEQDRRTLWTAVKRGRLDCIASDHHASKDETDDGVPGSELLFPLMLSAVRYGRLSLELLVSLCSESPARIFGLERKGAVEKGCDADLVLFADGEITKVASDELMSGAGWSPYIDREAAAKPEMVMVNGHIVARRGKLVSEKPLGRCVTLQA